MNYIKYISDHSVRIFLCNALIINHLHIMMHAHFVICPAFLFYGAKEQSSSQFLCIQWYISFLDHSMKFNVSTCHNIYLKSDYCLSDRSRRACDWDNRESLIYNCIYLGRLPTDSIKFVITNISSNSPWFCFILLLSVIGKSLETHMHSIFIVSVWIIIL